MAETRFIKTVEYGGYDKDEVISRLEYLNNQLFSAKNELRETKLLIEQFKKGTEAEKASEAVLAKEQMMLTSLQVQNDTLTTKLKATEEENKTLTEEVATLRATISDLGNQLADCSLKLSDANNAMEAMQASNQANSLSAVFIAAQQSANALVDNAKAEAQDIADKSKAAATKAIDDANAEAAQIIYEAERNAAVIEADSLNQSEGMRVANNNLKVTMLADVAELQGQIGDLKEILLRLQTRGMEQIQSAEERLESTAQTLKIDGVPTFQMPQTYEPQLPEPPAPPVSEQPEEPAVNEEAKSKLDALQKMAEEIAGGKPAESEKADEAAPEQPAKKAPISLEELTKQAEELSDGRPTQKKKALSLEELAKQAAAIQ